MNNVINTTSYNNNDFLYRDIILLYCPSKIGSTTIATSIRLSASNNFFVFHTHDNNVAKIVTIGNNYDWVTVDSILKNAGMINPITGMKRKVYVIDIYRPSIERKISEYFQDMSEIHFNNYEENICNYDMEKIITRFNNIFPHIKCIDYYKELYNLPIDVQNKDFNFTDKYLMYESNDITYIKLRLKDSHIWGNILTKILGQPIFIINDYKSKDKKIGHLYEEFNKIYKIPYNFYKIIESCPQLNFYFDENEKIEYLEKWQNKITSNYTPFTSNEYEFYNKLCTDNRFFYKNLNNHYTDDGCMCDICSKKREIVFEEIKNNNFNDIIKINHKYDNDYNNSISLNIETSIGGIISYVLNVINY